MGRQEITLFAEKHGVHRIVMSTHGRTGLRRWVVGSVADKVLRAADTTVVLVRPRGGVSNPKKEHAAETAKGMQW